MAGRKGWSAQARLVSAMVRRGRSRAKVKSAAPSRARREVQTKTFNFGRGDKVRTTWIIHFDKRGQRLKG